MIGAGVLLGIAVALASLAWDPSAHAAEPKRVLALLVAVVALAFALVRAGSRDRASCTYRKRSWSWTLGLGFLGLSALSTLWGLPSGRLELATWIGAMACGAAAAQAGRASAIRTARSAALLVGGVSALWALGAFALGARGFAIHAGQGNPNWLGLLLATTIPLSIETAVEHVKRRGARDPRALALGMLAALQPAALYASHSRVAWVATAIAVGWLAWSARRVPRAWPAGGALLALAALLTAGVIAAERLPRAPVAHAALGASAVAVASPEDVPAARSLEGRVWIAKQSLLAARHAGPLGAGLGRFGHVYLDAQGEALARLEVRAAARRFVNAGTAHDDLLQVAVESGPLAALLLLAALVVAFGDARRAQWHAGGAVLVAFTVTMLGDSPLRQPAPCVLLALVMAASGSGARSPGRSPLVAVSALAMLAGLLMLSTRAWLGVHCRETPALALRLDPDSGDAQLAGGIEELARGRAWSALPHLERANHLGATVAARVAIGEAWLAQGNPEEAREAFRTALVWHPGSLRARVAMAEAERRLGHLDEAERHSLAAHAVSPGDAHVAELVSRLGEARMDDEAQDGR